MNLRMCCVNYSPVCFKYAIKYIFVAAEEVEEKTIIFSTS